MMQTELMLSTIPEQSARPSFFELFIVQQLNGLLKPAMRHIVHYLADRQQLPALFEQFDGVYAAFITAVQWYCISMYNATAVEVVYGLQRNAGEGSASATARLYSLRSFEGWRSILSSGNSSTEYVRSCGLHDWQKVISILYAVILPQFMHFLRERALRYREIRRFRRERLREVEDNSSLNTHEEMSTSNTLCTMHSLSNAVTDAYTYFCTVIAESFPYLELAADTSVIAFNLMYVCGISKAHHPLFAILDMVLERKTSSNDSSSGRTSTGQQPDVAKPSIKSGVDSALQYSLGAVLMVLIAFRAAETLLNASDSIVPTLTERLAPPVEISPPPKPSPVGRGCVVPPTDRSKCPLCGGTRNNSCASSSGYVFCYLCLFNYVRQHGKCPVTGLPCSEQDIIRLYEST